MQIFIIFQTSYYGSSYESKLSKINIFIEISSLPGDYILYKIILDKFRKYIFYSLNGYPDASLNLNIELI